MVLSMLIFTCDGNGNGSHPVSGTSNGTEVIPSHLQRNNKKHIIKNNTHREKKRGLSDRWKTNE